MSSSLPAVIFPSSLPAYPLLSSNPSAICAVIPGGWTPSRGALQQRTSIEVDTPVLTLNLWNRESVSLQLTVNHPPLAFAWKLLQLLPLFPLFYIYIYKKNLSDAAAQVKTK